MNQINREAWTNTCPGKIWITPILITSITLSKILKCLWALILTKSCDCWRYYKRLCTSDNPVVRSGGYLTSWAWKQVDRLVTPDAAVSQTSVFSSVHSTKTPHLSPSQLCTSETWQMCPQSWRQTTNACFSFYTCRHAHVKSQIQPSHQFFLGLWAPFPPPRRNKYRCQVFSIAKAVQYWLSWDLFRWTYAALSLESSSFTPHFTDWRVKYCPICDIKQAEEYCLSSLCLIDL